VEEQKKKLKSKKSMLKSRPVGKQSGESVESALKKKKGRLRWEGFNLALNETARGDGILIIISIIMLAA